MDAKYRSIYDYLDKAFSPVYSRVHCVNIHIRSSMDGWKDKGTGLYHSRVIVRFTPYNLTGLGATIWERYRRSRCTMTRLVGLLPKRVLSEARLVSAVRKKLMSEIL